MTLSDIKRYLQQHPRVALADIAHHFDAEPSAVQAMLAHWIRKGKVKHLRSEPCSKGCCHAAAIETYEWQTDKPTYAIMPIADKTN